MVNGDSSLGARPLHAFTETNVSETQEERNTGGSGLVGILARRTEDDGMRRRVHEEDTDEERPLSPHDAILSTLDNPVMGSILQRQQEEGENEEHNLLPTAAPSHSVIVTTEPSLETEPSAALLQKSVTHTRRSTSSEEKSQEDRFADELEIDDANQASGSAQMGLTSSSFDYDTNWDMVGRRTPIEHMEPDQEDMLNRSGGSLLAEAAAASAMLASTAAQPESIDDSPSVDQNNNEAALQGIAPKPSPSSNMNYKLKWDAAPRSNESIKFDEQHHGESNIDENEGVRLQPSCSSLAEAATVSSFLKHAATPERVEEHPLQTLSSSDNFDSMEKTGRLPSQSRSAQRLRKSRSHQRGYDSALQRQTRGESHEHGVDRFNTRSRSAERLDSLDVIANEHNRAGSNELHFDDFVNPIAAADTRSEMNESIATSTSDSSAGSARRRRQSRRLRGVNWSLALNSSLAADNHDSSRDGSTRSAPESLPITPTTSNVSNDASSSGNASRLRASLDSGMAALGRWIRARSALQQEGGSNPRSSRAARRWQREHSDAMQLGEEDFFALANAGRDPRGSLRHNNDSSMTITQQPTSLHRRPSIQYPPSILEEEDESPRQRSLSEPDADRLRDFFYEPTTEDTPPRSGFRRRRSSSQEVVPTMSETSAHLQTAALSSSLFHTPERSLSWPVETGSTGLPESAATVAANSVNRNTDAIGGNDGEDTAPSQAEGSDTDNASSNGEQADNDPNREARTRWIRINRRFQLLITIVALMFSLLLFAVLVCWVVLTSAFVVSIDKPCDVPLKTYYWLATLQLILDIFRTDIMRIVFRWDTNSNERIPVRVIVYNIAYMTYAILVLRLGIRSVFVVDESTCSVTAPELFQSCTVFVILSILAWSIIVLGYMVPFCFVAMLLTWNGYTPATDREMNEGGGAGATGMGAFFPAAYGNSGAPPGCIDQLRVVILEEFPEEYPRECCICMGDFSPGEVIVATECDHVFHKTCCQEWLQQARTCPVCRTDIPSSLSGSDGVTQTDETEPRPQPRPHRRIGPPFPGNAGHAFGREEFHQEVVSLFRLLRQHEERLRNRNAAAEAENNDEETGPANASGLTPHASRTAAALESATNSNINDVSVPDGIEMEERRFPR